LQPGLVQHHAVDPEIGRGAQLEAFAGARPQQGAPRVGALGLPSVVIMALNPARIASAPAAASTAAGGPAGAPNLAAGRKLYSQVCVACHGPDGNLVADHKLAAVKAKQDARATIRYLKDPKAPMPKMFPDLLNEQSLVDVTAYLYDELR
jgi:mono/diheme cytochrome c family protein